MTPIETVQQIYAAFGRGDLPAIFGLMADDVEWEYGTFPNPVPWLQPLSGRDQVPKFFEALLSRVEMNVFVPRHIVNDGLFVIAVCDAEFTVRATGKRVVEHDEVHLWHLNDRGLVQRFRHRSDTWQQAMSLEGD
jgi:uncharacterized protein